MPCPKKITSDQTPLMKPNDPNASKVHPQQYHQNVHAGNEVRQLHFHLRCVKGKHHLTSMRDQGVS